MNQKIQPTRGMSDILPAEIAYWQRLEAVAREVLAGYGYEEMRVPVMEQTELFKRSIGEFTDIVEKEMYTFTDKGGESLTLRPEATAGMVRAAISNGLTHNQRVRVWCMGPMFRHEKPQKGRFRQFHQIDVEAFGYPGPDVDAEIILIAARFWKRLGIRSVRLEINSLGTPEARRAYREHLVQYLRAHENALDDDSRRRLSGNPLRILDSKNPEMRAVIDAAPLLTDHLDEESQRHFTALCALLRAAGIEYRVNPRLVRGLDYYTRTVFEWLTDALGAQDAVCSGGRYDGLFAQLGGDPTPAIGWAMGQERVVALMAQVDAALTQAPPHVYVVMVGEQAQSAGLKLAERLRDAHPQLRVQAGAGGGNFKAQFRRADRSGATVAVILGEDEMQRGVVAVKPLRSEGAQVECPQESLAARIGEWVTDLVLKRP
ncbi:MAG TPA: histidine--tRNA ligase [Steroidobacteraceae bacterium]|nr:histidine--tRNA ligase [Steroidobacteraceae bacterium]